MILLLFGTGIRGRTSLDTVKVKIGWVDAEVQYAGPQSEYPGLDQVNVKLPRTLAGRGKLEILLTADGKAANTVEVNLK